MDYITTINFILAPIFGVLQVFDFYSMYRISRGGGKDFNPVINFLFNSIGVVKSLLLTKTIIGSTLFFFMYFYKDTLGVTIGLSAANIIYTALVYLYNVKELKKIGI